MAKEKLYKNYSLSERMIMMLEKEYHCEQVPTKSSKYVVLKETNHLGKERFFFVGAKGAVRVNGRHNSTESFSVSDKYKAMLFVYEVRNNLL